MTTQPDWAPMVGFCQPGSHEARALASALERVRRRACGYSVAGQYAAVPCDCKYGLSMDGPPQSAGSEKTGCPELREVIAGLLA